MPLRKLPIRTKLALMFVSVCILTFGLGGYLVSTSAKDALESEIGARLEFQSRAYATALDAYLRMLTRRSEDFASDGFIRDHAQSLLLGSTERERLREELRAHLLENKLPLVDAFLDLTLIAPDGEILLAAHAAPSPRFVEHLIATHEPGGPWFSGLLPGSEGGHPRLAIATPLHSRDRDERLGMLVAWVHPAVWVVDALRSSGVGDHDARGQVALQLLDADRKRLRIHHELTDPDGPLADSELVRSGFGLELSDVTVAGGRPTDASYPIAANGWSVLVELQGGDLMAAVAGLQSRIVGLGIVLSVVACVLFLLPMRFLTRPLVLLSSAARRLASGESSTRVTLDADDEIGDLAHAFNAMAESVEERTRRLEQTADDLRERQRDLGFERDRLKGVISSMRDGLVVLDADGELVIHNRAAGPLLKQLRSEDSAITAYHICDGSESLRTECRTCLFSPDVGARSCVVEIEGGVFEIHAARLAPNESGRSGRVLVSRDLSDRVAQDERQIHHERLAVLGEVAAVMAHELNNPLAAISMYNQMLATELDDRPDLTENVEVIQRNVTSCKRTIRELLDYATNATPEVDSVDVNATLEDVSAFLRPLRERSNVGLSMNVDDVPLEVTGDEVQIRQIFVNLIVNAIQAIGEKGGHVTVETAVEDDHAVVHVGDDGPGIPAEVREKVFRPFFTTKGRGEGTGLGLPTARRIAEMHGGGLELVNSGAEGSLFRVRLRLRPEEAACAAP